MPGPHCHVLTLFLTLCSLHQESISVPFLFGTGGGRPGGARPGGDGGDSGLVVGGARRDDTLARRARRPETRRASAPGPRASRRPSCAGVGGCARCISVCARHPRSDIRAVRPGSGRQSASAARLGWVGVGVGVGVGLGLLANPWGWVGVGVVLSLKTWLRRFGWLAGAL